MRQPHMIKKLEQRFGEWIKGVKTPKVPATPHFGVVRPKEDEEKLNSDDQ